MKKILPKLLLGCWYVSIAVVVFLSLKPHMELPFEQYQMDKVYHVLGYCWLALLPLMAFRHPGRLALGVVSIFVLGGILEYIQRYLPGRFPSYLDLGANIAGILSGIALGLYLRRRWRLFSAMQPRAD